MEVQQQQAKQRKVCNFVAIFPGIAMEGNLILHLRNLQIKLEKYTILGNARKRSQKTAKTQYEAYVNFIQEHPELLEGSLNPGIDQNHNKNLWAELTNMLNSIGKGPQRKVEEWQNVTSLKT